MLMRTDPFREIDRLTQQVFGPQAGAPGMPMDAYRDGDAFVIHLDLPGVDPDSVDIDVERNVLTIKAERRSPAPESAERVANERPVGQFTRRVFLGDTLDTERIDAGYEAGVLTLRIPVAERAKPRKIQISQGSGSDRQLTGSVTGG
ncbi:Hsp20/alpha crystallin family protein [Streptomyces sp. NPDC005438]|uniref:Hsp20/alpha crystallin family protein n=1 Tax=Streptomyces sp. NPDC005438 TaxID=3156880 RepID=UPI0033B9870C